jgi:hypothetical protein
MRTPEASQVAAGIAGQVALTTYEGRTLTLRAADISAVLDGIPDPRDPVYTGNRCTVYWRDMRVVIRDTAANVLLQINAAQSAEIGRVFKFGQALDCDAAIPTDVWDGADGVTSTDIWVPPTTARIHAIASASANDADPSGTGLRTVRVYGLTAWDTDETSEVVALNGVTPVNTVNSYVIIHRMVGLTFGNLQTNAGIITATAATDGTITAAIQAGHAQTLMAIYGVPSTKKLKMTSISASVLRSGVGASVADMSLQVNASPDQADGGWNTKHVFSVVDAFELMFDPPVPFSGPALIKVQAVANTINTQVTAAFNALLEDAA